MENVFRIVFTNGGASACTLLGVHILQFVDGPHLTPEGPTSRHVDASRVLAPVSLGAHSSSSATVWSGEPVDTDPRRCGRLLRETGIELTFATIRLYVQTFPPLDKCG